jgi:hypothetical protein
MIIHKIIHPLGLEGPRHETMEFVCKFCSKTTGRVNSVEKADKVIKDGWLIDIKSEQVICPECVPQVKNFVYTNDLWCARTL